MDNKDQREVWQRGPISGVPALLQPVAHALLQAAEDAAKFTAHFPADRLWERPAGLASPGFHLLHIRGVIDRLFTYARGESLSEAQRVDLVAETQTPVGEVSVGELVSAVESQVARALDQLRRTPEAGLAEPRELGRKKIPTTVIGLLFHAAEHAQRHIGQLLVTTRILMSDKAPGN